MTHRGYESLKNLELYIPKRQKVITAAKTGQGDVLRKIREIDLGSGIPEGMDYDPKSELFYAQYPCEYPVNYKYTLPTDKFPFN